MPKFGDYSASTAPNQGDLLLIKDINTNSTKKITRSNLLVGTALPTNTVTTAAITDNSVTAAKLATNAITLGYAQITSPVTNTSTSPTQVAGLTISVTIPAGGRRVKVTVYTYSLSNSAASGGANMSIWDGTVGSGTQIQRAHVDPYVVTAGYAVTMTAIVTPSAGAKTYNAATFSDSGGNNVVVNAAATAPAFILVEAI